MRFPLIFFIFFLFFGLVGCNSVDSKNRDIDRLNSKIGNEESFLSGQGAGAVHATKKILNESPNEDIFTESAKRTVDIAQKALDPISIEEQNKWDGIADSLLAGSQEELNKVEDQLIKSERARENLEKNLKEKESERLALLNRLKQEADKRVEDLKRNQELKKRLVTYFAGAAVACTIGGLVLSYFLGYKAGLNAFIAAALFGVAAYLITQTFFAWIAGGVAVIMSIGALYYIWGRLMPQKTLKKTVDVIDKMSLSDDPEKSNAAKLIKAEIGTSLTGGKEETEHKKYIKNIKKKL